jgi:membrane protease YdiL (CAAX protease family)
MLSYKQWSPESLLRLFTHLFFAVGLVLVLGTAADKIWASAPEEARRFWVAFACGGSLQVAGLWLIGRCLRENRMTWSEAFGLRWGGVGPALVWGFLAAAGALVLSWGLLTLSGWAFEAAGIEPEAQASIEALRQTTDPWRRVMVAVTAVGVAPVFEEGLFRGILYPAIKQAGYPLAATWGTAFLFALTHLNLLTFLPLMVFALILSALYERTGHLLAPITAHAAFNAANYVLVLVTTAPA